MHDGELNLEELFIAVKQLLAADGSFGVLVPAHRASETEKIAGENKLFLKEKIDVRQTPQHAIFRTMYLFCNASDVSPHTSEIFIKEDQRQYSRAFGELLKDYYLIFDNALS